MGRQVADFRPYLDLIYLFPSIDVKISMFLFIGLELAEMRMAFEHEKDIALHELRERMEAEKQKAVEETKKKQWVSL